MPICVLGNVIGEIDVDSHQRAAFTETDRIFREEPARILGGYVEEHQEAPPAPNQGSKPSTL